MFGVCMLCIRVGKDCPFGLAEPINNCGCGGFRPTENAVPQKCGDFMPECRCKKCNYK